MSALKASIVQWQSAVEAFDANDVVEAQQQFKDCPPQSKFLYSLAVCNLKLDQPDKALLILSECLSRDEYFAVAYYLRGCLHLANRNADLAYQDFNDALMNLRGNEFIDYSQLGLQIKLLSWMCYWSRGVAQGKRGNRQDGHRDIIEAASLLNPSALTPTTVHIPKTAQSSVLDINFQSLDVIWPNLVVYRPPKSKVAGVEKRDWLGKSKVVAAVNPADNFTGFSGKKLKDSMSPSTAAAPPPLPIRRNSRKSLSEGNLKALVTLKDLKISHDTPYTIKEERKLSTGSMSESPSPRRPLPNRNHSFYDERHSRNPTLSPLSSFSPSAYGRSTVEPSEQEIKLKIYLVRTLTPLEIFDTRVIYIPSSTTYSQLLDKLGTKFRIVTVRLNYQDDGWVGIEDEEDWRVFRRQDRAEQLRFLEGINRICHAELELEALSRGYPFSDSFRIHPLEPDTKNL